MMINMNDSKPVWRVFYKTADGFKTGYVEAEDIETALTRAIEAGVEMKTIENLQLEDSKILRG